MIEDRGEVGPKELEKETNHLIELANANPAVRGLFTVFKANSPEL